MMLSAKIAEIVQFITKREKDLILSRQADEIEEYARAIADPGRGDEKRCAVEGVSG
jgi:hypothetical protein